MIYVDVISKTIIKKPKHEVPVKISQRLSGDQSRINLVQDQLRAKVNRIDCGQSYQHNLVCMTQ